MALTDMVIMPGADYQDACDAIREKTGDTELIKSGEIASIIRESFRYVDNSNLFDINNLVLVASSSSNLLSYAPQVDGTALLSGGVSGATAGAFVVVEVPENAVLNFRAVNTGESGNIEVRAIGAVTNGIYVHSETTLIQGKTFAAGDIEDLTFTVPSGYTKVGFAFYGATKYCMRLENISVALASDTAAALAIVMGDAE